MRTNRIYTDQPLAPEAEISLTGSTAHYLRKVLRKGPGARLVLFNGDGSDYVGEITGLQSKTLRIGIEARLPAAPEPEFRITLVQAISRGERMDYSLQKATELGVYAIQPLVSERVEVKLSGERLERRLQHWRGVIIAACEQSGRARLPELRPPASLHHWLTRSFEHPVLALEPAAEKSLLAGLPPAPAVSVVIGPEGGFESRELQQMQAGGVLLTHFGPRVLRTETAGPAAIAALMSHYGDLSG